MSIASGLLGYIGGTVKSAVHQKGEEKHESIPESRPCAGGHPDPGAVNSESGLRECDVALAVGQSAESYLNAAGVATELLQSDSLEEICEATKPVMRTSFVSIHCNAA